MKILLLSPNQSAKYNRGHQLFRNELGRQNEVVYYGSGYPNYNTKATVKEIVKQCYGTGKPDIILTYGYRYTKPFKGLGDITDIPKVHIAVDYFGKNGKFKGTMTEQNTAFRQNKPDLVFGVVGQVVRNLQKNNISDKVFLFPFSVDTNIYKPSNVTKTIDAMASFTVRDDVYPNRRKVHKLLGGMNITKVTGKVILAQLINTINRSRVVITSNNVFNSLSMRYTETLACEGFLLADKPEDFDELGYVDGKHLVIYKDLDDLKDKIMYYLQNPKIRRFVAKNGYDFVTKNHSNIIRAKQFSDIVKRELL